MKKIFIITIILSAMLNAAKLKYTTEKTNSYQNKNGSPIIGYTDNYQKPFVTNNMFYDGSEYRTENMNRIRKSLNNDLLFYGSSDEGMYSPKIKGDGTHMLGMLHSFLISAGNDYFSKNPSKTSVIERVEPKNLPMGIVTFSAYSFAGSAGYMTSGGVYFGDIINELSGNFHQTSRVTGFTKTEDHLYVMATANDNTIKPKGRVGGPDIKAVHPLQETFYLPAFGIEAQKLMRAQLIKVKDYSCNSSTSGNPVRRISSECFINDSDEKGRYPVWAFYGRANTVAARGDLIVEGNTMSGASFASPRLSGLITKIMNKYKGISYLQAKQIVLTTASRSENALDSYIGWGTINENKALNGPSMLVPGLIEEEKFFAGYYDKIFDGKGHTFFWAETENDWNWTNDIYGPFAKAPTGSFKKDIILNTKDSEGDIVQPKLAFITAKDVEFRKYIPSEYNFYADTAEYSPGLRKAGKGTLTISGNLYYEGPTQVLEGKLILKGNVSNSVITVYEGAEVEVYGKVGQIVLTGGKVTLMEGAKVDKIIGDPETVSKISVQGKAYVSEYITKPEFFKGIKNFENLTVGKFTSSKGIKSVSDIAVNKGKYQDIKREYFYSDYEESIKYFGGTTGTYKKLLKKYGSMAQAPLSAKEGIPGYKDGKFQLDSYVKTEEQEYIKYPNPMYDNHAYRTDKKFKRKVESDD